jgi:hypothetical protein
MGYTVLTLVPRLTVRPKPGEDMATGIREVGCARCVVRRYDKHLTLCWEHKDEHILWAEHVEEEQNVVEMVAEESEVSVLHDQTGVQESVDVS